jgi:nitroreductase
MGEPDAERQLDGETLLTTTRAVRRRLDLGRAVPRAVLDDCLRVALQAPTARNVALCRWLFVDDPTRRADAAVVYRAAIDDARGTRVIRDAKDRAMYASVDHLAEVFDRVPVLALPFTLAPPPEPFPAATSYWATVMPTIWSFQLALRLRGLGSTLTTVHLWRQDEMAEALGVPRSWRHVGLLPIAYTIGGDFSPAPRPPVDAVRAWNDASGIADAAGAGSGG